MADKKVKTTLKLIIKGGEATPAPPIGSALGQHGVAIMEFVKEYNDRTKDVKGQVAPALVTIYEDRSFTFIIKKAPVADMIKKKLGIEKGSGTASRDSAGKLTKSQLREIAEDKLSDLNTKDVEEAMKVVAGTARSMGIQVEE